MIALPQAVHDPSFFIKNFEFSDGCAEGSEEEDRCVVNYVVYRASFALFVVYFLCIMLVPCSADHNICTWISKVFVAIGLYFAFCFIPNAFFTGYSEVAKFV